MPAAALTLAPFAAAARRPALDAFDAFATTARAVADDVARPAEARTAALVAMDAALDGASPDDDAARTAARLREACLAVGGSIAHGKKLLQACTKDVGVRRFRNWSELLAYARF